LEKLEPATQTKTLLPRTSIPPRIKAALNLKSTISFLSTRKQKMQIKLKKTPKNIEKKIQIKLKK
jgi:hypothetical protein